ncbi:MAG: RND family efflux transporter MFP subunit [Lentisphaeria bacterium]|jgi:RND family efflux transporter MFP subunit
MNVKTKKILLPVLVLVAGILIFAGLKASKAPADKKGDDKTVPFVSVEPIELIEMQLVAHSQGEVRPRYQSTLVSQVSGTVVAIAENFVNGGLVKKDELLAQIDPFDYNVRLQQAKANLASARAAFIQERAQGRVAEAEWAEISSAEPSELGLRKPQQEQALAAVKAAEASFTQAQKDLERTEIRAPFDALVKSRNISPGTFVNIGGMLGEVMDIAVAEIRLPVNQDDFAILVEAGRNASVTLEGTVYGELQSWQAKVIRDEGMVDAASRMIYLVASINDPYAFLSDAPRLPFGTYVTAAIEGEMFPAAVQIPRRLFIGDKLPIIEDKKLQLKEVVVVKEDGKFSIVTGGVKSGGLLVMSTLDAPVSGMAVSWKGSEEEQIKNSNPIAQTEEAK